MNGRARAFVVAAAFTAMIPSGALAQVAVQPTREPIVTAENTPWYLGGEPIMFAGNVYYPAGPQVFFNRFEMIRSGFYEGVPLYTRTTLEPFSVVFVPVGGGQMQPYERRRAGDVAGTVGSTTPAFPVVTAPEQGMDRSGGLLLQAIAPPTRIAMSIGDTTRELTDVPPGSQLDAPAISSPAPAVVPPPASVGTVGRVEAAPPVVPLGPLRSAIRPEGLNGVFINYDDQRWFNSGPAVQLSSSSFVQTGEYRGFPVYREVGNERTIYVASTAGGGGLLTPYSVRRR